MNTYPSAMDAGMSWHQQRAAGMHALPYDVVGYSWHGSIYCPACLVERLIRAEIASPGARDMIAGEVIDQICDADPYSTLRADAAPIFRDDVEDEYCEDCAGIACVNGHEAEIGCYLDGVRGWRAVADLVTDVAVPFGYTLTDQDAEILSAYRGEGSDGARGSADASDAAHFISDEALEWLNDHTTNGVWEWVDGDLILSPLPLGGE